jgi:hypothetical protein
MGCATYGKVEVKTEGVPFPRNPNYLRLNHPGLLTGIGIINEDFCGIGVEKDAKYNFSLYARKISAGEVKLKTEIISAAGEIIAKGEIEVTSPDRKKYEIELQPKETCSHSKLPINLITIGEVDIEYASMFPADN